MQNFVWGLGDAVTTVAQQGILPRRTPDTVRSRVVAASEASIHLALTAGFLAAGPVISLTGAQAAYAISGVAALAAATLSPPSRRPWRATQSRRPSPRTRSPFGSDRAPPDRLS